MAANKGSGPKDNINPSDDTTDKNVPSSQDPLPEKCAPAAPSTEDPSKVEPSQAVPGKLATSASKPTAPKQRKRSKLARKKGPSAVAQLLMQMQENVQKVKEPAKEQPKPTETAFHKIFSGIAKEQAALVVAPSAVPLPPPVLEVVEPAVASVARPSRSEESEGAKEQAQSTGAASVTPFEQQYLKIAARQVVTVAATLQVPVPPQVLEVVKPTAAPVTELSRSQEPEVARPVAALIAVSSQGKESEGAGEQAQLTGAASVTPFEQQYSKIAAGQVVTVAAPLQVPVPPQVLKVARPTAAQNAELSRSQVPEAARPAVASIAVSSQPNESQGAGEQAQSTGAANVTPFEQPYLKIAAGHVVKVAAPLQVPVPPRVPKVAKPAAAPNAESSRSRQSKCAWARPAAAPIAEPSRSRQSKDARARPAAAPIAGPSRPRQSNGARTGPAAAPIAGPSRSQRSKGARRRTRPAAAAPPGNQEVASCVRWFQKVGHLLRSIIDPTCQQSDLAAFSTHLQSILIMDSHCFLMKSNLLPRVSKLGRRLGVLVRYQGECAAESCRRCPFPGPCQVCPHMFSCSCRTKYEGTGWCAHIHVAIRMKMAVYKEAMCLYVHSYDSCRVEMRHLRAYVQGRWFMEPHGGLLTYREKLRLPKTFWVPNVRTTYRMVKVDTSKCQMDQTCGVCKACRCFYKCSCEDYVLDRQNCQHCHWLAMWSSARRTDLFNTPPEAAQFDKYKTDCRYISSEVTEDRRFALELQHEMSYNLNETFLGWDPLDNEWHFRDAIKVTRLTARGMCRCGRVSTLQQGKACSRCRICIHHYKCNCEDAQFAICRHVHYAARECNRLDELPANRFLYLQQILFKQYPVQVPRNYGQCLRPPRTPNPSPGISARQLEWFART